MSSGDFLPVARPLLGDEETEAVRRVIETGWVTQGPEVAALERDFAAAVGAAHARAVSSCTAALHLALLALGVEPGDEVIVPSHSFIATANCIRHCSAVPVFVDIDPRTFNIAPERVAEAVTPKTRAVLCVHQLGMPCDLSAILRIARDADIPVVEDAACALGSRLLWEEAWEPIGRPRGDLACFSFHPRKLVTAGEGGLLTTDDETVARRLSRLRQHGMSVTDVARHRANEVVFESYDEVGFNYRMSDIQAAVARVQFTRLDEQVGRRRELASRYRGLLDGSPVQPPHEPEWARSNWQSYCVRLPAGSDQKTVMQRMLDRKIATRRGVICAHLEPAYRNTPWRAGPGGLVESERATDECILLPLFHELTTADQERVVETLLESL